MLAARDNKEEVIDYLLTYQRIDINQRNLDGETALFIACQRGYKSIVNTLLKNGANLNQTNKVRTFSLSFYISFFDLICKLGRIGTDFSCMVIRRY